MDADKIVGIFVRFSLRRFSEEHMAQSAGSEKIMLPLDGHVVLAVGKN
jgi:hypothetical protein